MPRRLKRRSDQENLERWLLTYADLITLLLAFFIVMYSMSQINAGKFEKVSRALQTVLGRKAQSVISGDALVVIEHAGDAPSKTTDINILRSLFADLIREHGFQNKISASVEKRGLVIRISESAFFDLGLAELKPEAIDILDLIAGFIIEIPNHVRIEGHTDNLPIKSEKYPSNWELSVNRATICVRYLIEHHNFSPNKISALGYGEYRPIASNDTADGRRKNRRIDVVVLSWEEKGKEPE